MVFFCIRLVRLSSLLEHLLTNQDFFDTCVLFPSNISCSILTCRWTKRSESGVLACSALKEQYRQTIILGAEASSGNKNYCSFGDKRQKLQNPLPFYCLVVLLQGSKDLIKERMEKREEHFMPSNLLDSQFETLEEPSNCDLYSAVKVSVNQTIEEITNEILRALKAKCGVRVSIQSTV